MTRQKLKLAYISDDMARKISYNKRKKSIVKKMNELTTLCGVPACAIISSPFDSIPEVWPDLEGVNQVIEMYRCASKNDKNRNVNHEGFIVQMISKAQHKLDKLRQQNCEKKATMTMFKWMEDKTLPEGMTTNDVDDINILIEKKMKEIDAKLASLN